jgi:uncharacterized linocin/CFP29 family protein
MNERVAELPWTDEQWSRIARAVSEAAQQARVTAKFLPIYGPIEAKDVAVPNIALALNQANNRLEVDSLPENVLTTLSVFVHVRTHEAADPELQAVLTLFRRAANLIARAEDDMMFNGQAAAGQGPLGLPQAPLVITGGATKHGLMNSPGSVGAGPQHPTARLQLPQGQPGQRLVRGVVNAIDQLEGNGHNGPYALVLASDLYAEAHTPAPSLALPRHAIVPMLGDGPLLRSSSIAQGEALLVSYSSGFVEQVLASDIDVKFLQVSLEPRFVFRVSERLSLRVKDGRAMVNLHV